MSRRAVLDACVLVPYNLASLLLTLGERELFEPRWSDQILEETRRALTDKLDLDHERADRRLNAMRQAFPEAAVVGFEHHIEALDCHPKDRHVLAAAIASDADVIVTFNLDDFPDSACLPHGVKAVHPEDYLLELLALHREQTIAAVHADAARRGNPVASPPELLAWLATTVPTFANMANQLLEEVGPFSDFPAYVAADPDDSPLAAMAQGADLTEPLQVASLWWLAVLEPDQYQEQLAWLTHSPEAWGNFQWATDLLTGMSLATKVYYAVDRPADVAVVRFVPEVTSTSQTFASFNVRDMLFLTLCRSPDGSWRAWGLGPRMVSARTVLS